MVGSTINDNIDDIDMGLAAVDRLRARALTQRVNEDASFQQPPIPVERLGSDRFRPIRAKPGWDGEITTLNASGMITDGKRRL